MEFCSKKINTRSKYASAAERKCHCRKGHPGKCKEYPFLEHLSKENKQVADKIKRDATMTTGASWNSKDAGPNRILRWVMLLTDEKLAEYGIKMSEYAPVIVAKLREKAADYDSCVLVAAKLTWLVYQMEGAPKPPDETKQYLEELFGKMEPNSTRCVICRSPLSYQLFSNAVRGKAALETCHKNPRMHNPDNVGFGHRECNIAQGSKTLDEFYEWIRDILRRAD